MESNKKLVETQGNKQREALTLHHINRLIKGYNEQGKAYFIHEDANTFLNNYIQKLNKQ